MVDTQKLRDLLATLEDDAREGEGQFYAAQQIIQAVPELLAAVDAQAAEIARLREALANLLSVYDGTDQQMTPGQYAKEARAALTPQEPR